MEFITQDGVRLAYTDQGHGQPVVILTGIGGFKEIWQRQVTALLTAGYRVINLDCRNQGQSAHTTKGLRISRHAQDLAELIQQLELKQVILMGNSMGAATIFAYVSLYGTANVARVIDVDQSPQMINTATWPYGFKALSWDNFYTYLQKPFGKSTFKRIDSQVYQQIQPLQKTFPYDAKLNFPFLVDHALQNWRDVLPQLSCPILFIVGANSPYFNPAFAPVAADLTRQGQVQVIEQSGHIVMAEQPEKFNQALLAFLKQ